MIASGCGATRYAWGRKSARETTTLHDLAATLSVMPEHISLCAEGEFDPWRAVTVRQPPVPPDGYRFAIALGLAMGEIR
nr:DNA utilization protein HofM [Salmonella sp. NCTC 7297]